MIRARGTMEHNWQLLGALSRAVAAILTVNRLRRAAGPRSPHVRAGLGGGACRFAFEAGSGNARRRTPVNMSKPGAISSWVSTFGATS
jgi:hypothetical protein